MNDKYSAKEKWSSLRYRIIIQFSVLTIIVVSAISIISYTTASNILLEDSVVHTQQLLTNAVYNAERFIEQINSECSQILYDNRVLSALQNNSDSQLEEYSDLLYASEKFRTILLANPRISAIGFHTDHFVLHDNTKGEVSEVLENYGFLLRALARQGRGKLLSFRFQGFPDYICLSRMIYDKDIKKDKSFIFLFISINDLQKEITPGLREYADYAGLYSLQPGVDIYNPVFSDSGAPKEIYQTMTETPFGAYTDRQLDELISYRNFNEHPWSLYLKIPRSKIFKRIEVLKTTYILLGIVSVFVASMLGFIIATGITRPLRDLVEGIKTFENAPQTINLKIRRNDEIGYLSGSFNNMSRRLDRLVNQVYSEELTRKNAELKALQAQINPHFLFNALESVSWMTRLKETDEANRMITALSDILNARMGRGASSTIPLAKEIDYLDSYVLLQRYRFEDKLDFKKTIDKRTLHYRVPSLMLQPLAENAIRHNDLTKTKLSVTLKSNFDDEFLRLIIEDNGKGLSAKLLSELNDVIAGAMRPAAERQNRERIGLENVARRIFLIYGKESEMLLESALGKFTRIIIRIPLDKAAVLNDFDKYEKEDL